MKNKKLYSWTTTDKLALAASTGELVVKIGDAYDTEGRVLREGIDLSRRVMLKTYDIGNRRDYEYHKEAESPRYKIRRLSHRIECETREAFAIPVDPSQSPECWKQKVIQLVDSIVSSVGGKPEKVDFIPTSWQRKAIQFTADSLEQGKRTILLELAARFGKTGTLTQLFEYSDADVMVVATYVKTVNTSFGDTVVKFFSDTISYLDSSDKDFETKLSSYLGRGRKVLVTCGLFNSSSLNKKIALISKIPNRFVVVDEADFGAHTPGNLAKVEKLREDVPLILMTGTNAERASGSHDIDAHLSVTYPDMLLEATN